MTDRPSGRTPLAWFKSSFSSQGTGYDCVEVGHLAHGMAVRDSKNPGGPAHAFSRHAWAALLDALRGQPAA
jgi:hypothetical protein